MRRRSISWASVAIGTSDIRGHATAGSRALPAPSGRAARSGARRRRTTSAWSPPRRAPRRGNRRAIRASTASERRSASKRATSSPSRSARSHRCGSSSRPWSANRLSCISQKRALQGRRLGGAGRGPGARVAGADGEVAEGHAQRQLAQAQLERGAERALEVGVDDRPGAPPPGRARDRPGPTGGTGAEPRSLRRPGPRARRRSGWRPGRSPGESAWWLHSTTPSAPISTSARSGMPAGCRTPNARQVAPLGSKSESCSISIAELLLERLLGGDGVAGDAVERQRRGAPKSSSRSL